MNKRFVSVLAFALLVSAAASLLLYRLIASRLSVSAQPSSVKVMVATRELPVGTLIRDIDVKFTDWTGPVPAQTVPKVEDVVNRGVIATIYTNEPIVETRLAPKGAGAGMAATIPVGMRAVAIRVNDVVGVAGFVVPGMRVDLLISGNPPAAPAAMGTQTKTLLQNIEVLSAGQNIQKDAEGKPISVAVVNLLVNPEQAEILSLASNETRIQLVLRNPLDTVEAKTPGTAVARLFGAQKQEPPKPAPRVARGPVATPPPPPVKAAPPPPPPPILVEVIHGTRRAESKFAPPVGATP